MSDLPSVSACRRMMEARQVRDEAKTAADNAEKEYRDLETDFWETLDESALVGTYKLDLGPPWGTVSFSPRETFFARVVDEQAAIDHFTEELRLDEVTAPKFAKRRLNEMVRECREQGKTPPPGIDWYARRNITITKQKGT